MKIGIICSAGGSTSFSALDMLIDAGMVSTQDVLLVVDRDCDASEKARARNIACRQLDWVDDRQFSTAAALEFKTFGAEIVFLFYTRIVTRELFAEIPTVNIHPSLLPSFAGFGALENACEMKVRFLGATLHVVDANIDGGEIVGQVVTPVATGWQAADFSKASFVQKTYLMLSQVELLQRGVIEYQAGQFSVDWIKQPGYSTFANPELSTASLVDAFDQFQHSIGCEIFNR